MAKNYFELDGMDKLKKDIKKLGKVPQKHVTASAKKGMNIVLKDARANAPYETGMLKKGIILIGEKSKTKGKKVYEVVFDRSMNDVFQKTDAEGNISAYYPVSQEYGFFTKNGRYIPGYRFIHESLANNAEVAGQKMITEMKKKIDTEIAKVGLRK